MCCGWKGLRKALFLSCEFVFKVKFLRHISWQFVCPFLGPVTPQYIHKLSWFAIDLGWMSCRLSFSSCLALVLFFSTGIYLLPFLQSLHHTLSFWPRAALRCYNTGLILNYVCVFCISSCRVMRIGGVGELPCAHMPLPPPLLHLLPSPTLSVLSNLSTNITLVLLATTFTLSQSETSWQNE